MNSNLENILRKLKSNEQSQDSDEKFEINLKKFEDKVKTSRVDLKHNRFYNVIISHYVSPDEFYIHVLDDDCDQVIGSESLKCKMGEIVPRFGKDTWDERFSLGIKYLLKTLNKSSGFKLKCEKMINQDYYEVSLYTLEKMENVSKIIVAEALADALESNEKKAEKQLLNMIEAAGENIHFSSNDVLYLLGFPDTSKFITSKSNEFLNVKASNNMNIAIAPKENSGNQKGDVLSPAYQHPNIEWFQQNALVCIEVDCKEALSYSLEVDEASVFILMKYLNKSKTKVVKIDLYGLIEPKYCSYTKNDHTIKIRLVKNAPGSKWPRLTYSKERNNFIKYCSEKTNLEMTPLMETYTVKPLIKFVPAEYTDDEFDEELLSKLNFADELDNYQM
jgi:hypothetical protein